MSRKKKKTQPRVKLPCWVLPLVMAVLCEVLLCVWTTEEMIFGRFAAIVVFSLGFACVIALLCSFFPKQSGKCAAIVLSSFLVVLYFAEYLIHDAFQNFMTVRTMQAGAGGVVSTYLVVVLRAIAINWWRIGLLLLPVVAFGLFVKPHKVSWGVRGLLAVVALALFAGANFLVGAVGLDGAKMREHYSFDSAVRSFGLSTALVLEYVNNSEAMGSNLEFQVDPVPEATEAEILEETTPDTQPQETEVIAETTQPVVYEAHTMGLDFAALAAAEPNANVAAMHQYLASLTPSEENAYTGLFAGKNLIFITAEAFCGEFLDPELTPTLYRLATQGIEFTEYYQPVWGMGTTGGEYTNLVGHVPTSASCMKEAKQQNLFLTMGKQLQALGYSTAAFHNNDYTFYSRHETHELLGYDYYMGYGNGIEEGVTNSWPQSDLEMIDYTLPMYIDQQPFHAYYMSVSGHSNYNTDNAMSRKNYHLVEDLDCSEAVKCYIAANLELENALTSLLIQLEEAGITDDTVIVVASDHYPYGLESSTTWGMDQSYLEELYGEEMTDIVRDRNTLIIWSGDIEDMDIRVDTPVFSLDILPTLLNLFGLDFDSRLLPGRDVFSDDLAVVFWGLNGSWLTEMGYYNTNSARFTPVDGAEVDEGYVERINTIVSNKIKYSKGIAQYDYYNYIYQALENAG